MNRRNWIKLSSLSAGGLVLSNKLLANQFINPLIANELNKAAFGNGFKWGVAAASYQIEGAWNIDGKGESVWDHFSHSKGKIENGDTGDIATDFYHRYKEDIALIKALNFKIYRFSLSWSRIFPKGIGEVNQKGVEFYHKVIDECIAQGIEPWITIFHWDHPQALEDQGGWTKRKMVDWFSEYTNFVTNEFGKKVKNWMIINEPLSYTALGHMLGDMAPGRKGLKNFFPAIHHTVLCQAEGGRIARQNVSNGNIGTTFVTSYVEPVDDKPKNIEAAVRMDALMNRIFIEPSLGMGYPEERLPVLKKLNKYMEPDDLDKMAFDYDFVGLQYYFRTMTKKSLMPKLRASEVSAEKRNAPMNEMNGEVYPEGLYHMLKRYHEYGKIKKIIVTENGTCVIDKLENGRVHDVERIQYFKDHLYAVLKAKNEGIPVDGYFVWSLTDNFEWDKGFRPRFGIVYTDYEDNLKRYIKDSGYWFQEFLK
jgi:beta-glucosidase